MDKNDTARIQGLLDEVACRRQVYEQVGVVDIFNCNTLVADTGLWDLRGDRVSAHR